MVKEAPIIRPAVDLSDFEESLRLLHDHISAIARPEAASYLDVTAASLRATYTHKGAALFLGVVDGDISGMFAYSEFGRWCAQLNYFYVRPENRGHGLGKKLVTTVLESSKAAGYYSAILSTLPKLSAARVIYQAAGFCRIPPAYPDLIGAEYYMRKL